MPLWLTATLLVVAMPLGVAGIQLWIRRRSTALQDGDHNEVAGFVFAIVGVIYAVLLAFVVIVSWEHFSSASTVVGQEAASLRTLYRNSVAFPPEVRDRTRADIRDYASAAITDEWPAMSRGEPGSRSVASVIDRMTEHTAALPAGTPTQQEYLHLEAARLNDLVAARSSRFDYVDQGLPGVLWAALAVGAVVTIGYALLFVLRSALLQMLMTVSLAMLIGVLLTVAIAINHPFAGDVAVSPSPLERVLADLGTAG